MSPVPRAVSDRAMRPRAGSSAKSLLLTILGEFVPPHRETVWTSTVVRALGALGIDERNARQAVARLAEQELVRSEKEGRKARWRLTEHGRHLLSVGTERIYGFGAADDEWDGRWLVVLCSVPEEQRAKRHQLRSQLGFAGFGFIAPGVAVSPHVDRERAASEIVEAIGLVPNAVILRAETGELVADDELLRRAWDLESLEAGYERFITAFERRMPSSDEARFAALVGLVHAWRRFPFVDPEIPPKLLPDRWPGRRARALFDARHLAWSPGADAWYIDVESSAG